MGGGSETGGHAPPSPPGHGSGWIGCARRRGPPLLTAWAAPPWQELTGTAAARFSPPSLPLGRSPLAPRLRTNRPRRSRG